MHARYVPMIASFKHFSAIKVSYLFIGMLIDYSVVALKV